MPGNPNVLDPNHWQPIELTLFIDQSGNVSTAIPEFVGPEWGEVTPFALDSADLQLLERDSCTLHVWKNPGEPVYFDSTSVAQAWTINGNGISPWCRFGLHIWTPRMALCGIFLLQEWAAMAHSQRTQTNSRIITTSSTVAVSTRGTHESVHRRAIRTQLVPRGDYARCLPSFGPMDRTAKRHQVIGSPF
jgi:hypothetical protein